MQCIYCLEDKSEHSFRKSEHVLPRAFGAFENNFTLNGVVCDGCNEYFANNLELYLARDTYEGCTLRYEYRIKKTSEFKSLGRKTRFKITVAEGPYKGAYVYQYYSETARDILVKPSPQVGFLKCSGNHEYYLIDNLLIKKILNLMNMT